MDSTKKNARIAGLLTMVFAVKTQARSDQPSARAIRG
jgi:hypothetical protein